MPDRVFRDTTNSTRIDLLSADAERLFYRLGMQSDDYGNFYADIRQIKAKCFPLKDWKFSFIQGLLNELIQVGIVKTYKVDNIEYTHILNFGQKLRRMKRKYPEPPQGIENQVSDKCPTSDGQMTDIVRTNYGQVSDKCLPETKRNEEETKRNETNIPNESIDSPESRFMLWIQDKTDQVKKMKLQLTVSEAKGLLTDFDKDEIKQVVEAMENYAPLLKKNRSVAKTIRGWIERRRQQAIERAAQTSSKPDMRYFTGNAAN